MSFVLDLIRAHDTAFGLVLLAGLFGFVFLCALNETSQS